MLLKKDITLDHFSTRKRYIKDDSGEVIEKRFDKLLVGLRVGGRGWLESHYTNTDDVVLCFMLGHQNIVFTYKQGDSVMYVNKNAGAQAREYIGWWSDKNGCDVVEVEDLPTAEHTRQSTKKIATLEDLVESAIAKTGDFGL